MNKSISKQIFLKFELFTVQDLLVAVAEAYLEPSRTSTMEPKSLTKKSLLLQLRIAFLPKETAMFYKYF